MDKSTVLLVPEELGVWLKNKELGNPKRYFTMIESLLYYCKTTMNCSIDKFIDENKKELIEVILGSREYKVEEPVYYALAKGHELTNGDKVYWVHDKNNDDMFIGILHSPSAYFLSEMSKSEWNELGINDSNADFVKVNEVKE